MAVVARRGLTGRAVALMALLALVAVLLASPLHRFISARASVSDNTAQNAASRAELARLQAQLAQLKDPAYVQAQARARLKYAMPGDTVYVVTRAGQASSLQAAPTPAAAVAAPGDTWNQRLWGSVLAAGAAAP